MSGSDRFADSYLALAARLWAELDALASPRGRERAAAAAGDTGLEVLRLELTLLRTRIDGAVLRRLLSAEQRLQVRSLIEDLTALLDRAEASDTEAGRAATLMRAQNRLFAEAYGFAIELKAERRRVG